jgi:hypothetical protein
VLADTKFHKHLLLTYLSQPCCYLTLMSSLIHTIYIIYTPTVLQTTTQERQSTHYSLLPAARTSLTALREVQLQLLHSCKRCDESSTKRKLLLVPLPTVAVITVIVTAVLRGYYRVLRSQLHLADQCSVCSYSASTTVQDTPIDMQLLQWCLQCCVLHKRRA